MLAILASTSRPCVGVGLAVPSAVSRDDEHALAALYLRWPAAVPVRDRMVDLLGPSATGRIHVGNDANLAALAEHRHGAGAGATDMLFLSNGPAGRRRRARRAPGACTPAAPATRSRSAT